MSGYGKLFVVATPIGNLEDITLRALRVLREADLVAAEDTRRSSLLLSHYNIKKPLVSYHEFNEARRAAELINRLRDGQRIALVSDAGMPTLSDPGLRLVNAALENGVPVEVVPGPSALTTAVSISGLRVEPFLFHGFLPHKSAQRRRLLQQLAPLPFTLAFFESPHRLHKTLADIEEIMGNRRMVIARELTKKFEEVLRDSVCHLRKNLENRVIKGEITLLIEGPSK